MPLRPRYVLAAYHAHSGQLSGLWTERGTLTSDPARADWMVSKASAEEELKRLQLETRTGWKDYIWCVEEVDPQDLVVSTLSVPPRTDPVVAEPIDTKDRPALKSTNRKPSRRSPDAPVPQETQRPQDCAPPETDTASPPAAPVVSTSAVTDTTESDMAVAAVPIKNSIRTVNTRIAEQTGKKLGVVPGGSKRQSRKLDAQVAALAVVPDKGDRVKKPAEFHTTRGPGKPSRVKSKPKKYKVKRDKKGDAYIEKSLKKAIKQAEGKVVTRSGDERYKNYKCLCGCGERCERYFYPGHVNRFRGNLMRIAEGTAKPSDLFNPDLVKKLGPWKPTKDGGQRPTIIDYRDLRPELSN